MSVRVSEQTLYVAGEWRVLADDSIDVVNPATEERLASIRSASAEKVEEALAAAREAQPEWARQPAVWRSEWFRRIADLVAARKRGARAAARGRSRQVPGPGARRGRLDGRLHPAHREWDRRIEGDIVPSDNRNERIHLMRVPMGVVGTICRWNFPIALYFRKAAPARVSGNAVVLKPSDVTPLSSIEMMWLIDDHVGLPWSSAARRRRSGGTRTGSARLRR
jgi:lactaldehyde dehydrogenase/glycolaldehyde dehydrogenase